MHGKKETGTTPKVAGKRDRVPFTEAELKYHFRVQIVQTIGKVMAILAKCSAGVVAVWFIARAWVDSTASLAGKQTAATIENKIAVDTNLFEPFKEVIENAGIPELAAVVVVIVSIVLARRSQSRAKDTIEQMAKFRQLYEKQIDPDRTSSELTSRGELPAEDRL